MMYNPPMLEAIILNYNPLTPMELQLETQMALFEKPHSAYSIHTPAATDH